VASKTAKHVTMRTHLARFPFVKGLDAFDFTYQPSLDKKQLQTLATCHFLEHGENLLILGPPGVGKTHLAVGLGLKAIEHGYRVLFNDGRLDDRHADQGTDRGPARGQAQAFHRAAAAHHRRDRYLPIDRVGANLFFQLVSRRYERGPMILTSNQGFASRPTSSGTA
jgi:DNA replication protein DnaC